MAQHRGLRALWLSALLASGCSGEIDAHGNSPGAGPGSHRGSVQNGAAGSGPSGSSGSSAPGSAGNGQAGTEAPPGARPDGFGEEVDPLSVGFECDQDRDPSIAPLKRLSMAQYRNSLRDLLDVGAAAAVFGELSSELSQFPIDGEEDASFKLMDGRVAQRHVNGYFALADAASQRIVMDAARLSALAGSCAAGTAVDAGCLRAFITDFGARALRRPLTSAEIARYAELNEAGVPAREVYRGVIFSLLMAPQFLYHFETEGEALAGRDDLITLDAHALAARLSYHFWQTMPDAELRAAADDGSLLADAGYQTQVERLFADPRTAATVQGFFGDWYRLDVFGGFATTPAFATFAQGVSADRQLYDDAVAEIEALIQRFTFDSDGQYADLLRTDLNVTRSPALAELYGVSPWDGSGQPGSFAAGQRSGLLTRAGMLISSNHGTNPFRRGAFIRRDLMCIPVKPPANLPPGALVTPPFDPTASTRERFERKVAAPECAGCHATFTPYGMALEAYDGLGRLRQSERLIDDDGNQVGTAEVNTRVQAEIDANALPLNGPVELSSALAESELVQECFARHYFRYTFRREEQIGDECALSGILERGTDAGSLRAALRDIALDPAFRRRVVQ
ncbi:MAG TPA: DUF1592 domain-containing protein [Polyangiales bacterium]|nr:DUF1592 domain-containing protein [Polyangiales bacterium]